MLKKVIIISSSPRMHGNSDTLCDEFKRGAEESGNIVEKIFLRNKKINYCAGCGFCTQNNYTGCSRKDDMEEILDKLIESDVVVLASPVYFYTVTAQMKTFIDRCSAKYPKIKDKDFYYIITASDKDKESLERAVECFRGFTDCLENPCEKGIIYATGVWHKSEINNTAFKNDAYLMGKNV